MCLTEREPGLTQQRLDRSVDTARPTRNGKSGPLEEPLRSAHSVSLVPPEPGHNQSDAF